MAHKKPQVAKRELSTRGRSQQAGSCSENCEQEILQKIRYSWLEASRNETRWKLPCLEVL